MNYLIDCEGNRLLELPVNEISGCYKGQIFPVNSDPQGRERGYYIAQKISETECVVHQRYRAQEFRGLHYPTYGSWNMVRYKDGRVCEYQGLIPFKYSKMLRQDIGWQQEEDVED